MTWSLWHMSRGEREDWAQEQIDRALKHGNPEMTEQWMQVSSWVRYLNEAEAGYPRNLLLHVVNGRCPPPLREEVRAFLHEAPWRSLPGIRKRGKKVDKIGLEMQYRLIKAGAIEVDGRRLEDDHEIIAHLSLQYQVGESSVYAVTKSARAQSK